MIWLHAIEELGLRGKVQIAILGDDTIFCGSADNLEILRHGYKEFFVHTQIPDMHSHGNGVRVDSITSPSKITEFCSKLVTLKGEGWAFARNPIKSLLGSKYATNSADENTNLILFRL